MKIIRLPRLASVRVECYPIRMKKIAWILAAKVLLIGNCIAAPAAGDKAVYSYTQGREVGTITYEITADLGQNKFTVRYQSPSQDYSITKTLLADDPKLMSAQSIENCRKMMSKNPSQEIATLEALEVNGQAVMTCHISNPQSDENWWYGDVPFGLVKKEIRKDDILTRMTAELISFEKH